MSDQCNPVSKEKAIDDSCHNSDSIRKLARVAKIPNGHSSKETLKRLKNKTKCRNLKKDATCLVRSLKKRDISIAALKKEFRPEHPKEWMQNPNEWLTNYDIDKVLKQYEEAHRDFRTFHPTSIDFESKGACYSKEMCNFSIEEFRKKGVRKIGVVINLDTHDGPGTHWVSLFMDLQPVKAVFYYFDSASKSLPGEINAFAEKHSAKMIHNNRIAHQWSSSECGMYSLYFISRMLECKGSTSSCFSRLFNNPSRTIKDKEVERFRKIFFIEPL